MIELTFNFFKENKTILKSIVAIFLVWLILNQIKIDELMSLFGKINMLILIPVLLYIPALMLATYKWSKIIDFSFWKLFKIYWISNFFSNFLPSTIGGDGYRVVKLVPVFGKKKIISAVLIDRISGVLGTLILTCLLFYFIIPYIQFRNIVNVQILIISIFIFLAFLILLINKRIFIIKKSKEILSELKVSWLKIGLISVMYPFLGSFSLWIYYYMFGYTINYFVLTEFYLIIQLISLVPISINAIGVYEFSLIGLLLLLGIPLEVSLGVSIISRFVMMLQTSIGGLIYIFKKD